ncbi:hypothetical protein [Variovorax sp. V15]|uniref:hypothetical protein n=1 Tax=Variovorax sp. V15 TaxID=3065952 RepID=UPI0034E8E80E
MHFSRSRFLHLAVAALAVMASGAAAVVDRVTTVCTAVYRFTCDFVASVPAAFEQPALQLVARPVELLQFCAYALRLAKRERPRMMPGWRMCPST